jgi:hypothetical protein
VKLADADLLGVGLVEEKKEGPMQLRPASLPVMANGSLATIGVESSLVRVVLIPGRDP